MPSLIWTRAFDDWAYDKKVLDGLKLDALHFPCIALTPIPVRFPKQKPQIFVFTSANAVRYSTRHAALMNLVRTAEAVYAVGPSTLAALTDFKVHAEIPKDVQSAEHLAVWLSRNITPHTTIAIPSAKEPSFDFKEYLGRYAIHVEVLPVYQTQRAMRLPNGKIPDNTAIERMIQTLEGVVCFASPSSVEGFVNTLAPRQNRLADALTAIVIGPTTQTAALPFFNKVEVCADQSVLSLAEKARTLLNVL